MTIEHNTERAALVRRGLWLNYATTADGGVASLGRRLIHQPAGDERRKGRPAVVGGLEHDGIPEVCVVMTTRLAVQMSVVGDVQTSAPRAAGTCVDGHEWAVVGLRPVNHRLPVASTIRRAVKPKVVEIGAHAGRRDGVAVVHLVKEVGNAARSVCACRVVRPVRCGDYRLAP